jgi:hypothetical protein
MKPMRQVAQLLNDMLAAGLISNYAVFGAVAQMRYTEAVPTEDADVLVEIPGSRGPDILAPIFSFCRSRGFHPEGQRIRVGEWPVQFIPPFNPLTEMALREGVTEDFEGVPIRVVRADYLVLIALDAGRPKDIARIMRMVEAGAVTLRGLTPLAQRFGLARKLKHFASRYRI